MVRVKENLISKTFGRLTVLEQAEDYVLPNGRKRSRWLCRCNCGNTTIVEGSKLKNGHTKSCHHCNTYEILGSSTKVIMRNGSYFFIDTEDIDIINQYCWYKSSSGYIVRREGNKIIGMHRELMNPPKGMIIDHINGIKTDNRKSNLRICTYSQNNMNMPIRSNNTSGYTGVLWDKQANRWKAQIHCDNKIIHLGSFINIADAIEARKNGEQMYFKEFIRN